jgi:hypothetical protein
LRGDFPEEGVKITALPETVKVPLSGMTAGLSCMVLATTDVSVSESFNRISMDTGVSSAVIASSLPAEGGSSAGLSRPIIGNVKADTNPWGMIPSRQMQSKVSRTKRIFSNDRRANLKKNMPI